MPTSQLPKRKALKAWRMLLNLGIFSLLAFFIFKQGFATDQQSRQWNALLSKLSDPYNGLFFLLALLLVPVNWGIESLKWQILLKPLARVNFKNSLFQVLTGVTAGFISPNRIGEHFGRIWPLRADLRLAAFSNNVRGSFAQVIVTMLFGLIGLFFLLDQNQLILPDWIVPPSLILGSFGLLGFLSLFLFWQRLIEKLPKRLLKTKWGELTSTSGGELRFSDQINLIGLSMIRYLVYCTQYLLICKGMGMDFQSAIYCSIPMIFFYQTLSPGLALVDLGIRGNLAVWFLSPFCSEPILALAAALTIWLINLVLPAIAGSFLMLSARSKSADQYQTSG